MNGMYLAQCLEYITCQINVYYHYYIIIIPVIHKEGRGKIKPCRKHCHLTSPE